MTVRFGVLGAGRIGRVHARAVASVAGAELVAVADPVAEAARHVADSPVLELMTPASLGIVCFRVNPDGGALDDGALHQLNRKVLARVFWEERAFMSSTLLRRKFALRMCVINHSTTWDDVRETLETIERLGRNALAGRAAPGASRRRRGC